MQQLFEELDAVVCSRIGCSGWQQNRMRWLETELDAAMGSRFGCSGWQQTLIYKVTAELDAVIGSRIGREDPISGISCSYFSTIFSGCNRFRKKRRR
jgi:hypothetical protein